MCYKGKTNFKYFLIEIKTQKKKKKLIKYVAKRAPYMVDRTCESYIYSHFLVQILVRHPFDYFIFFFFKNVYPTV
jgi:hypothetical protein